ncbi:TRAMP complex poly(A) polymerase subunit Cid14 [Schizosaccharomyces pombe]|uniref:Poly(A) RNA polymerase cid14 n=1 Tax=Schizosaccharomyces pombe (strain 972 / ATCC 24843) TaxID=284812 RepID=CID14_SCHPO|nr:poly(A) polymerase Cid14 [Schizosaccharomyces pombe]Q9UTN3.2 RecName: Full=Poly(A) RNA polymerase cid14; Short=PAP; AltName: Full=Caffeine-induced death protein 14; AltName: Full=Polynucleotide adenylyltransferase cid14 [Schizosaccharomyces pombe 972h-]CAI79317.1 poly(A) polymerase Cid14 [Schizosaccharomyces pombe]|eukprot:NP_001018181.1 poly(A) polymerase Cid14 [Schizosaccharomyces pombe]
MGKKSVSFNRNNYKKRKNERTEPLPRRIFKNDKPSKFKSKRKEKDKNSDAYDEMLLNNNFTLLDQEEPMVEIGSKKSRNDNDSEGIRDKGGVEISNKNDPYIQFGKADPLEPLEKPDLPEEAIKRGEPTILLGIPKREGRKTNPVHDKAVENNSDFIKFDWNSDEDEDSVSNDKSKNNESLKKSSKNEIPGFMRQRGRFFHEANEKSDSNRKRKRQAYELDSQSCPWHRQYKVEREVSRIFHQDILHFIDYITPTPEEHAVRKTLVSRINQAVLQKWPDVSLYVFGSFETKLYLPTSDLDLVIISPEHHYRGTKKDMFVLAHHLKKLKLASEVQVITTANVPIIKFVDPLTKVHVDISFNQPGGLKTCLVVNGFMKKYPALRPLVIIIKHFLNMRALNEVFLGGLSSYAIVCLVVSFLQLHPRLSTGSMREEDNFGVLLLEFLELYGKQFYYDAVGIAVHNGGFYFSKKKMGWLKPNQPYLLSIQDPVDFQNDVSKSSRGLLRVKATFANGFDLLTSKLYALASRIEREGVNRVKDFPSILSTILSVDEGVRQHREHMLKCYKNNPVPLEPLVEVDALASIDVDKLPLQDVGLQYVEDESDSDETDAAKDDLFKVNESIETNGHENFQKQALTSTGEQSSSNSRANPSKLFNISSDDSEDEVPIIEDTTASDEESRAKKIRKRF